MSEMKLTFLTKEYTHTHTHTLIGVMQGVPEVFADCYLKRRLITFPSF